MNYAKMIIQIRAKLNLSHEQLAKKVNVSFSTLIRWENGKMIPSKKQICVLENLCKDNYIDFYNEVVSNEKKV